jgi:hypothetical protein
VHKRVTGKHKFIRFTIVRTWGKSLSSPLIVLFVLGHEAYTQMLFCLGLSSWESRNFQNWDFCEFEGP